MKNIPHATISIARSVGFGSCKACHYALGCRSPRGELYLIVSGGHSVHPRSYHFTCWAEAVKDYEGNIQLQRRAS